MGKRRRTFPDAPQPKRQRPAQPPPKHKGKNANTKHGSGAGKNKSNPQHVDRPIIPFSKHDKILLVGEGDLSFAASLVQHHGCTHVTATVMEKNHEELLDKYPHVDNNIAILNGEALAQTSGEDRKENEEDQDDKTNSENNEDTFSEFSHDAGSDDDAEKPVPEPVSNKVIYNIDATRLPSYFFRPVNHHQHIFFNFPHVGGKTTDVNRQVRHNQSLLVSFFKNLLPALLPKGSIIVTIFEGEPYTLWNIRDLARHSGLAVEKSFKFDASWYPGYRHARTLGALRKDGGKGAVVGERGGAWKGEERPARSYVFRRKMELEGQKPRKKKDDDSSDED